MVSLVPPLSPEPPAPSPDAFAGGNRDGGLLRRPNKPHPPRRSPNIEEAPAASGTDDKLAQLKQLGELRDAGVLTDAEFENQKGKILYGS